MEFKKAKKVIALIAGGIIILIPVILFLISLAKRAPGEGEITWVG